MSDEINIELFGATKRMLVNKLKNVIEDKDYTKDIEKEEKRIAQNMYSYKFGENKGDDVQLVVNFEKQCMILQKESFKDIKRLTVREFYTLLEVRKAA